MLLLVLSVFVLAYVSVDHTVYMLAQSANHLFYFMTPQQDECIRDMQLKDPKARKQRFFLNALSVPKGHDWTPFSDGFPDSVACLDNAAQPIVHALQCLYHRLFHCEKANHIDWILSYFNSYVAYHFILSRPITLWCLRASSSTYQVRFSKCFAFCCGKGLCNCEKGNLWWFWECIPQPWICLLISQQTCVKP